MNKRKNDAVMTDSDFDLDLEHKIKLLNKLVMQSKKIVFFGGAGVSTESGIPDFRSAGGIYDNRRYRQYHDDEFHKRHFTKDDDLIDPHGFYETYTAEDILSRSFFETHPREFFRFYRDNMLYPNAEPNAAHKKLAHMENRGKDVTIVTQNIDGLHQKAGSKKVIELHGTVWSNHCMKCGRKYHLNSIRKAFDLPDDRADRQDKINERILFEKAAVSGDEGLSGISDEQIHAIAGEWEWEVPRCSCGGIIKPDVVLYGEMLNSDAVEAALKAIRECDLLIIAGTSLTVYPAAEFIRAYRGENSVYINLTEPDTPFGERLMIKGKVGEVLSLIKV